MKIKAKSSTNNDGTNRISALQRLSKPSSMNNNNNNSIHSRLSAPTNPIITDARQLLTNRNKPVFDARQLLSRQPSQINNKRKDMEFEDDDDDDDNDQDTVVLTRVNNDRLTVGTSDRLSAKKTNSMIPIEPISFTKTISNAPLPISTEKVVISFENDQYRKRARSPSPSPPPIRRLNDASIQTTPVSRRIQPSIKRTAISKEPLQSKQISSSKSDAATILITNLQSTVTEDDIIELFSEIGNINQIKTLSRGCIQVTYSTPEEAEDAVAKYHNRLLDGQLMYVSLQQSLSTSSKSSKNLQTTSTKISIDPSFIRQALFNPSNNTTNPVQFQVKL